MSETRSSSRILDVTVRRRMPYPVAVAWHRVALALSVGDRLDRVLDTYGVVLRTLASFLLPDYFRGPPVSSVEASLPKLARPSDGHWMAVVRELVRATGERDALAPFIPEASDWLFDSRGKPSEAAHTLDELIALRNRLRHGSGAPSPTQAAQLLDRSVTLTRKLLGSLRWLTGYRPFRVLDQTTSRRRNTFRGHVQYLVGSSDLSEPESIRWGAWLIDGRVYLASPDGATLLELHPFLQVIPDPHTQRERVFLLKAAPKMKDLAFVNQGSGIEIRRRIETERGDLSFERWLSQRAEQSWAVDNREHTEELAAEVAPGGPERVIAERYEVIEVLGAGGMAVVYRVWDREFEQETALKVLDADFSADATFRQRFRREARLMARLGHPNILGVTDVGQLDDGRLYIKMPVAQGGSLRDFVGSDVPEEVVRTWAHQALAALAHLHQLGIVHRDIKPGNLLLDADGQLLVSDFGIALEADDKRLTLTMEQLGSLAYMAPEQRQSSRVDGRADVYSLAMALHELIEGERPVRAPGTGLAGHLGELIAKMGQSDPDSRLTAAEALALLDGEPEAADHLEPSPAAGADSEPARDEDDDLGGEAGRELADIGVAGPGDKAPGAAREDETDSGWTDEEGRARRGPLERSPLKAGERSEGRGEASPAPPVRGGGTPPESNIGASRLATIDLQPLTESGLLRRRRPITWIVAALVGALGVAAILLAWPDPENETEPTALARKIPASGSDPTSAADEGAADGPDAGGPLVRAADGMPQAHIAGVSFHLGLDESEVERHRAACREARSSRCDRDDYFEREVPPVRVRVDDFLIDRYEVSRAQYEACVAAGRCAQADELTCDIYDGEDWEMGRDGHALAPESLRPDVPRSCVTRAEAETYCRWVGGRLPTEAEWELAAKGPEGRVFAWGDHFDPARAASKDDGENFLALPLERPTGATPEGVMHLSGNVYEWVADDYCDYREHSGGDNPRCRAAGRSRGVIRGGSFASSSSSLRTTFRRSPWPDARSDIMGFRCVESLTPP